MTTIYAPQPVISLALPGVLAASEIVKRIQAWNAEQYLSRTQLSERDRYVPLPWVIEELLGTTWINFWTGSGVTIDSIVPAINGTDPDSAGRPTPLGLPTQPFRFRTRIGLWWDDRFCIENWWRIDHLAPAQQLDWMSLEVMALLRDRCSEEAQAEQHRHPPIPSSTDAINFNMHKRAAKRLTEDLRVTQRWLGQFAEQHGLPAPVYASGEERVVRATAQGAVVQPSLF